MVALGKVLKDFYGCPADDQVRMWDAAAPIRSRGMRRRMAAPTRFLIRPGIEPAELSSVGLAVARWL